jgi:Cu(I)/Ag(I) efflux system membrane fusion protein
MSLGALDDVWVKAEVFASQAAQVKVGQLVTMTLGFVPGKTWHGQVDYVYPTLDSKTRTLRVRLRFANADMLLKPNMFAQVIINTDSQQQTLLVPKEAVIRTGTQDRGVLVVGEGQYKSVEVNLGQVSSEFAQILDGVEVGEQVVISAQFLLDSESSIHSDFMRMTPTSADDDKNQAADGSQNNKTDSGNISGVINQINAQTRLANISRGAIDKWGRGPATMDFIFADELPLKTLQQGDKIDFTFEVQNGDFLITDYALTKQEHNHD